MRKAIIKEETIEFGYIKKTHGVKGEVLIVYNPDYSELIDDLSFVFFEVDGLLVPFCIDTLKYRNDNDANVKFELIETQEEAQDYVGCKLFIDEGLSSNIQTSSVSQMLLGYTLIDKVIGLIGEITEVNDFNNNVVLSVKYHGNDVMIPLAEELILSLDEDTKTIVLQCPNGIFNLE